VTLVNVDVIDPELVEDQAIVFFLLGQEVFQPFLTLGLLLLQGLDDVGLLPIGALDFLC
jgi:hypothetical protein